MKCKACNGEMPVSWRYVEEIDQSVLEDLCYTCLNAVRSSLVFPMDNTIEENLELLGIHVEHDHVLQIATTLGED